MLISPSRGFRMCVKWWWPGRIHPALTRLEDLSGQSVAVRRSSSYRESLTALNLRLAAMGREPARIIDVDENLESEDIMEMVGAGVLPLTVVDQYRADLWAGCCPGCGFEAI